MSPSIFKANNGLSSSHCITRAHSSASCHLWGPLCFYRVGLHEYSGIISSLEGQVISSLNSIHNLNSPLLCNKFTGSRDWNVAIFVGDRGGVTSFWLLQLFITHWVPLSLRATSSLHWFPLYSPKKYLTTYSKYQMTNGTENSDILRIRNLSNFVTDDSEFQWGHADIF